MGDEVGVGRGGAGRGDVVSLIVFNTLFHLNYVHRKRRRATPPFFRMF